MARGRPSSYKEAYCNEVIECLAQGHSIKGFAGQIGVAASSVYKWVKDYPAFAEAYEIAQAKAAFFWEVRLIELAKTGKGNPAATIYGIGNRAPDEWRNVQKLEHTGKDGGPIKTQDTSARDKLFDLVSRISERERETENKGKPH